jgi:hypothetical protein
MEASYTVRLTRGSYVVDESDAVKVLQAIEERRAHVLVQADAFGDGLQLAPVRLITAHVVSVIANPACAFVESGERRGALRPVSRSDRR